MDLIKTQSTPMSPIHQMWEREQQKLRIFSLAREEILLEKRF